MGALKNLLRLILLLGLLMVVAVSGSSAQETGEPVSDTITSAASAHEAVPVPQASDVAMQRYRSGNVIWFVNQALALGLPLLFLYFGWSGRIRDFATRIGRRWFFIVVIYFIVFSAVIGVLQLPWVFYIEYIREHSYGLSNQTIGKWVKDTAISTVLSLVVGALVIWIPYLLLKRSPKRWWIYTGFLVLPFILLQVFITPLWISPLFNEFGPMKDKALEAKILALAARSGIEGADVFEVAKSEDTNAVNAYVTGFMGSKRIVLWDTAIEKLEEEELLFVMGHEMGHFVMHHVARSIAVAFGLIFLSLYLIHRVSGALIGKYGDRWGFHSLADIASLPLIMVLMGGFSLLITPLMLGLSRYQEHEADRFGIELTHYNHAAATGFVTLQEENIANPDPGWVYMFWRSSHPSIAQRIEFFNGYRPWETGEPVRYEHLFVEAE